MLTRFFLSERNMMVAILINAIIIFLLYFPGYRNDPLLESIDHLFILFFIIEAVVKIRYYKARGYFQDPWNRFDLTIVLLSIPSVLVNFIPIPDTSLVIILRLFRLVRLVRFIRFIPNMGQLMTGLGRALKASVFVLGAVFFLNFLLAIFTCHIFGRVDPEHFGDPLIALYSIFQLFTLEGWNEIPADIVENLPSPIMVWGTRFYFGFVVLIGGIFGMSLANAVFVDEMTMDNNLELEQKIDKLHEEISDLKHILAEK
jgi:voltage-gated sodium channel